MLEWGRKVKQTSPVSENTKFAELTIPGENPTGESEDAQALTTNLGPVLQWFA